VAKKKQGILSKIWRALVWAISKLFHALYHLTKWVSLWLYLTLITIVKKTNNTRKPAIQPSNPVTNVPLELLNAKKGSLTAFEEKINSTKSSVGLVLGARGSGKSALGMRLLENVAAQKNRPVYAMGFNPNTLPNWIHCTEKLDEIPNGAFTLVDEGGVTFSSRQSMSKTNQLLSQLILIARHKDISVLFISQNSANLEINAIRQSDYLLLRKPSLLQMDFERKKIGDIYARISPDFEKLPENGRLATYIYSDEFEGFTANQLPSFWNQRISKTYSTFKLEKPKTEK
jgi:hypothetical protein